MTRRSGLGFVATGGSTEWAIAGDSVVELRADRSIARSVRIGTPSAIAVGSGAVWAIDTRTGELSLIAAAGVSRMVRPAPNGTPIALEIAGDSLWVLDQAGAQLLRLDLRDGRRVAAIPVAERPTMLVSAAGALYVGSPLSDTIVRVDPANGAATTLHPDLGSDGHLDALGGSADRLLLGSRTDVLRLDPITTAPIARWAGLEYVSGVGLSGTTLIVLTGVGTLVEASLP